MFQRENSVLINPNSARSTYSEASTLSQCSASGINARCYSADSKKFLDFGRLAEKVQKAVACKNQLQFDKTMQGHREMTAPNR